LTITLRSAGLEVLGLEANCFVLYSYFSALRVAARQIKKTHYDALMESKHVPSKLKLVIWGISKIFDDNIYPHPSPLNVSCIAYKEKFEKKYHEAAIASQDKFLQREIDTDGYVPDITKARMKLGLDVKVSLTEAIVRTASSVQSSSTKWY